MSDKQQSVDELVKKTLLTVGVPVGRLFFGGEADEFITFQRIARQDTNFADDDETGRLHNFAAAIFSKSDYLVLLERLEQAVKAAGFEGFSVNAEIYERDTGYYHVPVEFEYLEILEV